MSYAAALSLTEWVPSDAFFLNLSFIILPGYVIFRVFGAMRMPGAVGVLLAGCLARQFAGETMKTALPSLQTLAFVLVLCRAGCEIHVDDLTLTVLLLATVPILTETCCIGLVLSWSLEVTFQQGLLAGAMLSALGDGLVIPIMQQLRASDLGPLPRIMACVAPLEATFALFMYAFLASSGAQSPAPLWARLVFGVVLKLAASIGLGLVVGFGISAFCNNAEWFHIADRRVFSSTEVEEFLVLLGASLFVFGLAGEDAAGEPIVSNGMPLVVPTPPGHKPEGLMLPELALICTTFFCAYFSPRVAHYAETLFEGLWVFGALFLFAAIGAGITDVPRKIELLPKLLPALACGLAGRFVACLVVCGATARKRLVRGPLSVRHVVIEATFCVAASLPRATIQGVLAARPAAEGLYPGVMVGSYEFAGKDGLLQTLAQATLALMAPCGQLLLTMVAKPLLTQLSYAPSVLEQERKVETSLDLDIAPPPATLTFHRRSTGGVFASTQHLGSARLDDTSRSRDAPPQDSDQPFSLYSPRRRINVFRWPTVDELKRVARGKQDFRAGRWNAERWPVECETYTPLTPSQGGTSSGGDYKPPTPRR